MQLHAQIYIFFVDRRIQVCCYCFLYFWLCAGALAPDVDVPDAAQWRTPDRLPDRLPVGQYMHHASDTLYILFEPLKKTTLIWNLS